jgi:hypothetical protein
VPAPDDANVSRLHAAARAIDATPTEFGAFAAEGGGDRVLYTRLGRLDLMTYVEDEDGELTYDELVAAAEEVAPAEVGHVVRFASRDHLISMKEHAGRDEDLRDVSALRAAQGLEDGYPLPSDAPDSAVGEERPQVVEAVVEPPEVALGPVLAERVEVLVVRLGEKRVECLA